MQPKRKRRCVRCLELRYLPDDVLCYNCLTQREEEMHVPEEIGKSGPLPSMLGKPEYDMEIRRISALADPIQPSTRFQRTSGGVKRSEE